jgi:hypothetical protein
MQVDLAIGMLSYGFSLVPVHKPINKVCTCGRLDCPSPAKHPIPARWQELASKQPDSIKAWWKAFKSPNSGVVTGKASGVVVLDIDPRHGGMDTLDDLQVKHGRLPETATVETGSGGFHYYFKDPSGLRNSVNVGGQGVDFRGDNGFVVGPGSEHASGGTYDWYDEQTPDSVGFAQLPKWLYDLVYKPPVSRVQNGTLGSTRVSEGGRNVWLTGLAGAIRNRGCGYKVILAALIEANLECCHPPLNDLEITLISKSISKYPITREELM